MVLAIVNRELVFDSVQQETAFRDPIAVAANDRPEVRVSFQIRIEIVKAENDIVKLALAIGNFERSDDAAIVGNLNFHATLVSQSVDINVLSVQALSKAFLRYCGLYARLTVRVKVEQQNHRATNHGQTKNFGWFHETPPAIFRYPKALAPGDEPQRIDGS